MFEDEQFFVCEKNCAVFVALDSLSESHNTGVIKPPTSPSVDNGNTSSSVNRNSKNQKSTEQQQQQVPFRIGDRVMAFDDYGGKVHGTVKWTGGSDRIGKLVGIETVSVFVTEFVKRGLIHASNFSNLRLCNSACV